MNELMLISTSRKLNLMEKSTKNTDMNREDRIALEIKKIDMRIRICMDNIRKEESEMRILEKQKERWFEIMKQNRLSSFQHRMSQ